MHRLHGRDKARPLGIGESVEQFANRHVVRGVELLTDTSAGLGHHHSASPSVHRTLPDLDRTAGLQIAHRTAELTRVDVQRRSQLSDLGTGSRTDLQQDPLLVEGDSECPALLVRTRMMAR